MSHHNLGLHWFLALNIYSIVKLPIMFAFYCRDEDHDQIQLGGKGFISAYSCSLLWREVCVGTVAGAMEKHWLGRHDLLNLLFLCYLRPLFRTDTVHNELGSPLSIIIKKMFYRLWNWRLPPGNQACFSTEVPHPS